jgi:hypothetical protein
LALLVFHGQARTMADGFGRAHLSSMDYAATQCGVIFHYLRLSAWPSPLVVDYGDWPIAHSVVSFLPSAIVLFLLVAATGWAVCRGRPSGFLGAWFFLILAPSSSFLPIATEVAAERRMYLPLAAVIVFEVLGMHRLLQHLRIETHRRLFLESTSFLTCWFVLGCLTVHRNVDYHDQATLMRTVVAVRPYNARAHYNLAINLNSRDPVEAIAHYQQALRIEPRYADAHHNLGILLAKQGRLEEAIAHFNAALRVKPNMAEAHNSLGAALATQGRLDEALRHFEEALRLDPGYADARRNRDIASATTSPSLVIQR